MEKLCHEIKIWIQIVWVGCILASIELVLLRGDFEYNELN